MHEVLVDLELQLAGLGAGSTWTDNAAAARFHKTFRGAHRSCCRIFALRDSCHIICNGGSTHFSIGTINCQRGCIRCWHFGPHAACPRAAAAVRWNILGLVHRMVKDRIRALLLLLRAFWFAANDQGVLAHLGRCGRCLLSYSAFCQ